MISGFAACAAFLSAAHSTLLSDENAPRAGGLARYETSAAIIQDTTRKAAPSSLDIRALDQVRTSPLPRLKRLELPFTLHVDELEPKSTTLEDIDSLGRLYPELKNFLLKQVIIQGALAADKVEFERRKTLGRLFTDLKLYNEMEAALRLNNARYGTSNNPLRPPPMPNQINLLGVLPAISNLLHALGLK